MSLNTDLVVFRLFDLHASPVPVTEPGIVEPSAGFLYSQEPYGARQEQGTIATLGSWVVRPLTRELQHDYFWRSYFATRLPDSGPEVDAYWHLPFPFKLTPQDVDLRLRMPQPELDLTVGVEILLWPTGWSSNLTFSVSRSFSLDEVAAISRAVHGHSPPPFRWNGQAKTLSEVFKDLSRKLRDALFTQPDAVYAAPQRPRYAVTLVASSDEGYTGFDRMSGSDRSRLHSILRGEEVGIAERLAIEKAGRFLVTTLSRRDFALTDFDRGILVSAANAWSTKSRTELKCLASNIRKALVMSFALLATVRMDGDGRLQPLKEGARRTLRRLPQRYDNPVLHSFLRAHSSFASLRSGAEQGGS